MANIGTLAKSHLNGVLLVGRGWPAYSGIWILSPLIKLKKKHVKLTPSDKIFLDPRMQTVSCLIWIQTL